MNIVTELTPGMKTVLKLVNLPLLFMEIWSQLGLPQEELEKAFYATDLPEFYGPQLTAHDSEECCDVSGKPCKCAHCGRGLTEPHPGCVTEDDAVILWDEHRFGQSYHEVCFESLFIRN